MRRFTAVKLLFFFSFAMAFVAAAKSKDDDDDWIRDLVDVLNLIGFIFAGGPEEIVARMVVLAATTLVAIGIVLCCSMCRVDPDRYRPPRAVDDMARGALAYQNMRGLCNNWG